MKFEDLYRELVRLKVKKDTEIRLLFPPDINERFKINECNFVATRSILDKREEKDIIYLRAVHPKWEKNDE